MKRAHVHVSRSQPDWIASACTRSAPFKRPAQEIFERIHDEHDGGDFQNPKRHHGQAVGDKELNECRHHYRHGRKEVDQRIGRQHDVLPEINEDQRDRWQRDEAVNEAATQKNDGPICEITHRLREQRIDLAFANVGGDLPFVLCRHDEIANQNGEQIIINYRAVIVAVQFAAALLEHRGPEKYRAGQGDQAKKRAQKIIPAIHKRVLEADVKDRSVLRDVHGREI